VKDRREDTHDNTKRRFENEHNKERRGESQRLKHTGAAWIVLGEMLPGVVTFDLYLVPVVLVVLKTTKPFLLK